MGVDDDSSEQVQQEADEVEEAKRAGSPPEVADDGPGAPPEGEDPMEGEAPSG